MNRKTLKLYLHKHLQKLLRIVIVSLLVALTLACTNRKNTAVTRLYHNINTRYNIHFNANEAYNEALKSKLDAEEHDRNLSTLIQLYPIAHELSTDSTTSSSGQFTRTIDKTTKAIKLHSISRKPMRDRNRRGDKEYEKWLKGKEFNPFLHNTWMLLGKAEFQDGNYLRAISTFMYITKIYDQDREIVAEANLWIAKSYTQMGWSFEARNILRYIEQNNYIANLPKKVLGDYYALKATLALEQGLKDDAIDYLQKGVAVEQDGTSKRAMRYLLAQLYQSEGENIKAYEAYGKVLGLSTPYNYAFNAKLNRLLLKPEESTDQKIKSLTKWTKNSRNQDYLDQLHTAIGDLYLADNDTLLAIEHYTEALESGVRNGFDMALANVKLGRLYFETRKYLKAQTPYANALNILTKTDSLYSEVSFRSEVLDKLVVYAKDVYEQDSLLYVANLPEADRLAYIEKHIEKLRLEEEKKKKAEQRLKKEQEEALQNIEISWDNLSAFNSIVGPQKKEEANKFYFYNPEIVKQGKTNFQKQWGKRVLEDNWRNNDKSQVLSLEDELDLMVDAVETNVVTEVTQTDENEKLTVEYYLEQLPLTEEDKQASLKLIEDGLFQMALVYRYSLMDNSIAIETFNQILKRFPLGDHTEEIYYQLFLIYLQADNEPLYTLYRNLLLADFPDSKYVLPLSDENYAWNFKYLAKFEEELYQQSYDAYNNGNVEVVRANYNKLLNSYPFVSLMPKFTFLNALTYAQTREIHQLEKELNYLVGTYPDADVSTIAKGMLENIKNGMVILSSGNLLKGVDWQQAYADDTMDTDNPNAVPLAYRDSIGEDALKLVFVFPKNSIDRNELLYNVADFNFSNYVVHTFDLRFDEDNLLSYLEVSDLKDIQAANSYLKKAMLKDQLFSKLDSKIIPIVISKYNHTEVYPILGLDNYIEFFKGSEQGAYLPQLIAYWNKDVQSWETPEESESTDLDLISDEMAKEDEHEAIDMDASVDRVKEAMKREKEQNEERRKQQETPDNELNLNELIDGDTQEILDKAVEVNDKVDEILQDISDNPVEGIKNLFKRKKIEDNLTKEEKKALKEEQKRPKALEKEEAKRLQREKDNLLQIEKSRQDSINLEDSRIQEEIERVAREEREKDKQVAIAKEQEKKDKEQRRKEMLREREQARRAKLKEQQEKQKERENRRKALLKEREKQRKERLKEQQQRLKKSK